MLLVLLSISLMKILLLPSYHSTDFEVHRNWLAITHSLPYYEWYKNDTSEWTLDYPPIFAFFEWLLSQVAFYFDSKMLIVKNLNYSSDMTVLFQRVSVILTDILFGYAVSECIREIRKQKKSSNNNEVLFAIIFGNIGLLIVDHIHFQYNGFLFGFLLLSIARILQKREIEGGFWFALLLNMKHIYLYMAPAYFIYLLRSFCFQINSKMKKRRFSIRNFVALSVVVISVFALSFGPFILQGQLYQVLSRLFPFKRGLCHSYWAPNLWSLYNFVDKISGVFCKLCGVKVKTSIGTMTSGLVQEYDHDILPSISPPITFILTLFSIIPCLIKLWRNPNNQSEFVRSLTMCAFCSYMFGWHVHEKAILLVLLPLSLLSTQSKEEGRLFHFLCFVGHFSLFPLIFTPEELVIKVALLLLHSSLVSSFLQILYKEESSCHSLPFPLLSCYEEAYICGLAFVFLYETIIHKWIGLNTTLPFLPLMMISVYCSLGVIYSWFRFYKIIFKNHVAS